MMLVGLVACPSRNLVIVVGLVGCPSSTVVTGGLVGCSTLVMVVGLLKCPSRTLVMVGWLVGVEGRGLPAMVGMAGDDTFLVLVVMAAWLFIVFGWA